MAMGPVVRRGRPVSIPFEAYGLVFHLHAAGVGFRAIAKGLERIGVATTRSSVFRLVHGLPPYSGT